MENKEKIFKKDVLLSESIHEWGTLDPNAGRANAFQNNDPSQLAIGRKIVDTYHAFTTGRQLLYYSLFEDHFGDLAKDDDTFSKLDIKSTFAKSALLYLGLCRDLSWQTVWAYIHPVAAKDVLNESKLTDNEEGCKYTPLIDNLKSIGDLKAKKLKKLIEDFQNNTKDLCDLYNYTKHRGNIAIEGLNDNTYGLPSLSRKKYTLEDLQLLEYNYVVEFMKYYNDIINILISEKYKRLS